MDNIKKFTNYLNEDIKVKECKLFFSTKLKNLLKSINHKISSELLELLENKDENYKFSYVDLSQSENKDERIETLSVLPSERVGRLEGITEEDLSNPRENSVVWGQRYRQPIRIGVFVVRLLPKWAGTKDLENFVHLIKGKLDSSNYKLKLVHGEEIRHWYHVKTYYNPTPNIVYRDDLEDDANDPRTPLMKSCLKQPEKQSFFDIYCQNETQVGMLIMLNDDNKLVARAIIWFDCFVVDDPKNPTKGVLMDRIYYTNESDVNIFIDYAKERGWWYKTSQAKSITTFYMNDQICKKTITTKLKYHGDYDKYPYLDTLCYYTPDTGRLSTSRGVPAKNRDGEIMERYLLQKTNGGKKRLSHTNPS